VENAITAGGLRGAASQLIKMWERPLAAAILALEIYAAYAVLFGPISPSTTAPYYNYLADAFLHGQLHLRLIPANTKDLVSFQGNMYLYWAPFPAILLVPFVAALGVTFSDVAFTLGISALNVAVVALLLRVACLHGVFRLNRVQRGLLVLFFALGTVHITMAPYGRVWATGLQVGVMCVLLCYLAAVGLRGPGAFLLTGLAAACALLTRNHLLFTVLWPGIYLMYRHRRYGWAQVAALSLLGALPILLALGLYGGYNWLRFGNVLDNGYAYHRMDQIFAPDFIQYGLFNLHYLPTNVYYQYVFYPLPLRYESSYGGSLFLLSPVFFAVFWALVVGTPRWSAWLLLGTIVLVNVPILLLMGTGWIQFGPRYSLDFMVPLIMLTGMGVRRWPLAITTTLTAVSVVQYAVGTVALHL
jgi:hypothetical protein